MHRLKTHSVTICKISKSFRISYGQLHPFQTKSFVTQSTATQSSDQSHKFADTPQSKENPRNFMDLAAKKLKIQDISDWYHVSYNDLIDVGGSSLLKSHSNSIFKLLSTVYPDYEWLPWKFDTAPRHFWSDIENQRKFMEWAGKELKIKELSDWYKILNQDLIQLGGRTLLASHSNTMFKLLSTIYPDYEWLPWKFEFSPRHFWPEMENQRKFMDWAGKELKIKELSDWYHVSNQDLIKLGGVRLLQLYSNSIFDALSAIYPYYKWLPHKFDRVPRNFWRESKNHREFMEWAGKQLKVKELSDWYHVTYRELQDVGGSTLLKLHSNSIFKLLSAVYPEYEWVPYKFDTAPQNSWSDMENQRKFMEWAGKELKIQELDDWYNILNQDLINLGACTLLQLYSNSLFKLLSTIHPEHEWMPWRFSQSFWDDVANWKVFMDYAALKLNIKEMNDWYNITAKQIIDLEGGILLVKNDNLFQLLSQVYPKHSWEISKFSQSSDIWNDEKLATYFVEYLKEHKSQIDIVFKTIKNIGHNRNYPLTQLLKSSFPQYSWTSSLTASTRKSQHILKSYLDEIFPAKDVVMLEDYKHPDVQHLELDYFYPQQNLAFEYQGQQHYKDSRMFQRMESIDSLKKRDKRKVEVCKDLGITLIEIPYWWDRKLSSLTTTIYNQRPDLFQVQPQGTPIPTTPIIKEKSMKTVKEIFMTTTEWDFESMEPKGWYMTEKYDGMRLFWNGKNFVSRLGNTIKVPESITQQLPPVALDGELWTQYGLYQDAVNLCKTINESKWKKAIFWVFDSPQIAQKPLEERIQFLQQLQLPSFAKLVEFVKCEGKDHLKQFNAEILKKGGEGVMLREPGSVYKAGRSTSLRRFKPFLDTEVKIVKNQYPHGFICEQMNEREVFVKITENTLEEMKQLQIGDIITVKHSGFNVHGTLMFPQFYRKRTDVKWDDANK